MAQTASKKKKPSTDAPRDNGSGNGSGNGPGDGPSASDRAAAGLRIAEHVRSAATGGKLRRGWSLWRATRELPVAAAGATDLFRKHPIPIALLGGALTTAGLLYAAHAMGAFDEGESEDQQAEEPERQASEEGEDE